MSQKRVKEMYHIGKQIIRYAKILLKGDNGRKKSQTHHRNTEVINN